MRAVPRQLEVPRLRRTIWHNLDFTLLFVPLVLVGVGAAMIHSAYEVAMQSPTRSLLENTVARQGTFALVGMVGYLLAAAIDYRSFLQAHRWVYAAAVLILLVTLALGESRFGAQSWLGPAMIGLQPAEFSKVLMILVLAKTLGQDRQGMESPRPLLVSLLLVLPPVALIYQQPDFGTALVLTVVWATMVFLAGVPWRHLLTMLGIALLGIPAVLLSVWNQLPPHMRERVDAFFHPHADPSGASYNVTQALIGIGSGGALGKGWLHGTQSQLHFLRVRHTDFIFSVLAEELGFAGAMLLILLLALLVLRLLRLAERAPDPAARLIVVGVCALILVQAAINIGMNANLLPVTGLPLPLISYGGSSLLSTLFALGLAQGIAMRSRSLEELDVP